MTALRLFTTLCFSFLLLTAAAQHRVSFIIQQLPSYHRSTDSIFIAGNFNGWRPGDPSMKLLNVNGKAGITIELKPGMHEFKFTRGSWNTAEVTAEGKSLSNRKISITSDTTVEADIEGWSDHFPAFGKKSTASKNVHLLDSAFFIPQLGRYRKIWIYLPESYGHTKKEYPVLYMHDGQNLFDEQQASFGEWGVDEALDSARGEVIIVAIAHGQEKRINEYAPYDMEKHGRGEGNRYLDFLVKTLKPYIDKRFRTKKSRQHTFIAGSSMGGLISFYALLRYPKVFGGAGVFSPAFWIQPELKNIDPSKAKKFKGKIYFYAGRAESERMVPDMLHVFEQMRQYSKARIKTVIRTEAEHNEAAWRAEFPSFFKWMVR